MKKLLLSIFSWENNSENENERFLEFLEKNFGINWIKTAKIEKSDDRGTLRLFTEKNFISLKLKEMFRYKSHVCNQIMQGGLQLRDISYEKAY